LTTFRRRRGLLFQFRLQIFRRRVGIFSLFFLCCFYFLLKLHVNFSSVFYRDYRAVVTSSRHRPFCFHNFVFLLNCLFVLYNAHIISVVISPQCADKQRNRTFSTDKFPSENFPSPNSSSRIFRPPTSGEGAWNIPRSMRLER